MSAPQFRNTPNPPMSAPHVHVHSDVHHDIHSDDEADGMPAECRRRQHVFAYSPTHIRRRKKTITFFSVTRPKHGHSPQNRRSRQKTTTFLCDSARHFYATVSSILRNGVCHSFCSILLQAPFMYSRHAFPPHINQTRHIFLFLTKVFLFFMSS